MEESSSTISSANKSSMKNVVAFTVQSFFLPLSTSMI
jgi:hypothetical protein